MTALREKWWLAGAILIAGLEILLILGIWIDRLTDNTVVLSNGTVLAVPSEAGPLYGDVLLTGAIAAGAAAILAGLYLRSTRRSRGHLLMVTGLVPAAAAGVVFFWYPPMWAVSALAVAVIVRTIGELNRAPEPVSV
jgi:hypothetical protein